MVYEPLGLSERTYANVGWDTRAVQLRPWRRTAQEEPCQEHPLSSFCFPVLRVLTLRQEWSSRQGSFDGLRGLVREMADDAGKRSPRRPGRLGRVAEPGFPLADRGGH